MCGSCHTETHFEWQVSSHRQEGLECIGCHDPHQTSLKAEDSDDLCSSCHSTRAENFSHSAHSRSGLSCADCHLGSTEQEPGDGHGSQDHSFYVSLSTCTECHAYQLHDPEEVHPPEEVSPVEENLDAMASVEEVSVISEPKPVSPIGFTTVAGMVGVALGIIIAPWLERWRKNIMASRKEGE
jgi:predicted CXXCH cytochrome family protein